MAQHYSDQTQEDNPTALPDVEVFEAEHDACRLCEQTIIFAESEVVAECGECGMQSFRTKQTKRGWFYWFGFPGCLPDSEPGGPYDSEQAALDAARDSVAD